MKISQIIISVLLLSVLVYNTSATIWEQFDDLMDELLPSEMDDTAPDDEDLEDDFEELIIGYEPKILECFYYDDDGTVLQGYRIYCQAGYETCTQTSCQ